MVNFGFGHRGREEEPARCPSKDPSVQQREVQRKHQVLVATRGATVIANWPGGKVESDQRPQSRHLRRYLRGGDCRAETGTEPVAQGVHPVYLWRTICLEDSEPPGH